MGAGVTQGGFSLVMGQAKVVEVLAVAGCGGVHKAGEQGRPETLGCLQPVGFGDGSSFQ
ncbi:hypothetical protein [Streptomyces zaomyceticus]|uniref:hypothetical protein n=1 Tax=Streptomyces zaomyceticus TaxID=68286 RepID=UPI0037AC4736